MVAIGVGDDLTCTITNTAVPPTWSILKLSDPESGATVEPGEEITYGVFLIRHEGVDPRNVVVNDDLSQVLNNATLVDGPTTCADLECTAPYGEASIEGTTLTWNVPVLDQTTAYVQYTVRVNPDAYGVTLKNQATSPGSSPCVPEDVEGPGAALFAARALSDGPAALSTAAVSAAADELCPTSTEHYTPAWSLEKTSDPESGSEVDPGDQVTYTLTVTNTTDNAVVDSAVVTDDLSDVLQYATLDAVPAGATLSGSTLTWNVPVLQPGGSAELSYTVTVDDDAYDVSFANVATPGNGGKCTTCTTTHETPPAPDNPDNPAIPTTRTSRTCRTPAAPAWCPSASARVHPGRCAGRWPSPAAGGSGLRSGSTRSGSRDSGDRVSSTAHPGAEFTGRQPNDDLAGSTHVHALGDDEGGVLTHLPVHSQVASERRSRRPVGRGPHSAAGERVVRVIALG